MQTKQQLSEELQMLKVWDTYEIQKLFGKHAFLMAQGKRREDVEALWTHRFDTSLGGNDGFYLGYESILKNYVEAYEQGAKAELDVLCAVDPAASHAEDNLGAGSLVMHCLTTPLIEVADDRNTAKAMWYSPGHINRLGPDGKPVSMWAYQRYGVDFIREEGEWKIWHLFAGVDFHLPAGEHLMRRSPSVAKGNAAEIPVALSGMPRAEDFVGDYDVSVPKLYSIDYGWSSYPPMPEPYDTFANTFSYGAEPFLD